MPIKQASEEQIAEMKKRLSARQHERSIERDMDEVVRMVTKHPLVTAPKEVSNNDLAVAMAKKAVAYGMLAAFGAILWNIAGFAINLMLFFAFAALSIKEFIKLEEIMHE